ncbi:MAG: PadR family transcriptional regulator [Candidatus Thorarchaeota archaeon]|jgi:DNA-binding PadR family transcriptional regulator
MRSPELKSAILKMTGKSEFYGYEIHKELEHKKIKIGIGRLYSVLGEMMKEGLLKDRWEKSQSGPKRRVYRISKKGNKARDVILGEAIRTVHDFYMEYLQSLPPEHSVFNTVSDMLGSKMPKNAQMAYAADRFSGPVKKLVASLQARFPNGNLYAIHPLENGNSNDLGMENVSIVDGTFKDIPMKENYLDLLIVTDNVTRDCLSSCLDEWKRVVNENGTLALVMPTALLVEYKDPLGIGDYIEQREHARLDSDNPLYSDVLVKEMKKHFEHVDVDKVVHITIIRGFNPRK